MMTQTSQPLQNDPLYEPLNFAGLERRGNYRLIAYREDVLHVLDKKEAAAIIFHIVYRWQTEYKRDEILKKIEERKKTGQKPYTPEEIEDMLWIYMSYNDFVRESGGAVGYNTVIRTLEYLVNAKKVFKRRENHDPKYSDYEYTINKDVVRVLLQTLPIDPAFAPKIPKKKSSSTQLGIPDIEEVDSTQMGTQSTQTGIASTQMGTEVYPNGGTSQNPTGIPQNYITEDTDSARAIASPAPSTSLSQNFTNSDELTVAIRTLMQHHYHIGPYGPIPGGDLLFELARPDGSIYFDTPEHMIKLARELSAPATPTPTIVSAHLSTPSEQFSTIEVDNPQLPVSSASLPIPAEQPSLHPIQTTLPDALGVEIDPKAVNIPTPPNKRSETHPGATISQPHDELTDIDISQQASGISYSQQEATPKPVISKPGKSRGKPKPEKVVELPALTDEDRARIEEEQVKKAELEARHKGIYTRIVGRRGYELTDRKDIIVEWTHVHKLAGKFNDAQIEAIHKYLFDEDWKFSKTENKYSIGAYLIWKESGRVAQILRERRKQKQTGRAPSHNAMLPPRYDEQDDKHWKESMVGI